MTPEQLRAEIAKDDATLEEVQRVATKYQRIEPQCAICGATVAHPEKCFGRCVDYPGQEPWIHRLRSERRLSRQRELIASLDDLPAYERHTVDITRSPMTVEDELVAFDRGWRKAWVAWMVLGVLVAGYVVWRWVNGGGQ